MTAVVKKVWCVDVDLSDPRDVDFTLRFSTEKEAIDAVQAIFTDGYVSRDQKEVEGHKYDTYIYPLERVRVLRLWEDKP